VGSLREYETVFILHPSLEDQQIEEEIEGVRNTIEAGSGEIVGIERWGRRKLAYEIRKVHEGFYTLIRFRADVGVFRELERRYRLRESVLRHLTIVAQGPPPEPPAPRAGTGVAEASGSDVKPEPGGQTQHETVVTEGSIKNDDETSGATPETISTSDEPEGSIKTPTTPEADTQLS
jgi:small subunit ribosomal protein S6